MRVRVGTLGLLLAGWLPLVSAAVVMDYRAGEHASAWRTEGSPLLCSLRHEIPRFGEAEFRQEAGGELGFALKSFQRPFRTGKARLSSMPPPWRHGSEIRDLGTVDFADGKRPFRLQRALSRRLMAELERGMFPTLTFSDWADGADQVTVALSAVNVRDALGEFVNCLGAILPFSFQQVRASELYFEFGRKELTEQARGRLDDVARYVVADGGIKRIELHGHTDDRGFRRVNKALSEARIDAVRAYLVARGVAADLVKGSAHGERRPAASNRTSEGRAKNRRVEVQLIP